MNVNLARRTSLFVLLCMSQVALADSTLTVGERLTPNQFLESDNRSYRLYLQGDGNVVLRDQSNGAALWSSQTNGQNGTNLSMQGDGNLVLYTSSNSPVWATGTNGSGATRAALQDDGNFVLYTNSGTAVWATGTNQGGSGGQTVEQRTLERRITNGNDDAEESSSGSVSLSSSDLELVYDRSNQTVGMRFTNISIPQGATIDTAYIQFTVDERNSGSTNVRLKAQDSDNAAAFSNSSRNISNRPVTNTSAAWRPSAWNNVGEAGSSQRTPELRGLVQEVVDRSGWQSGNAMAFIVTGTGERTAESYNGSSSRAPLLHIEYSVTTGGSGNGGSGNGEAGDGGSGEGNGGSGGGEPEPTNQAPSVSFSAPAGNIVESNIGVVVAANDSDGDVTQVQLFINNTLVRTEGSAPYEWGTSNSNQADAALSNLSAGTYALRAVATDNDGASTTVTKTVTVEQSDNGGGSGGGTGGGSDGGTGAGGGGQTAESTGEFSAPSAALYSLNDTRERGFPRVIDHGYGGNGHAETWDGRIFVRTRTAGWFASVFRPERIARNNDGSVSFNGAFGSDIELELETEAPDMQHNWLAIVKDPSVQGENPYPSDANGNYSANGTHATYRALVYHTSTRNGDNDQMGMRNATFIVRNARTRDAQLIRADFTSSFRRMRLQNGADFRCIEPSATVDGRLVICQGHPDNNGRIDNLVYSWNPIPGASNNWRFPKSLANMYWDDRNQNVDGLPFFVRFPIAEQPILDATGNDFARGELIKGAYPWVSHDGSELFYQASRDGTSGRRTGTSVVGRWTGWTIRHIDGPINRNRADTNAWPSTGRRLFISSPGAFTTMWSPYKDVDDLKIPYSVRGPSYPIFGSNSRDYSEVSFDDYTDGNYVLYYGMNEQLDRAGSFQETRTNDSSGNFNNGTLVGARFPVEFNGRDELVGRYGQAIYFNGGNYINVTKNQGWSSLSDGISVDFWVRKVNGSGTIRLFNMADGLEVFLTNGSRVNATISNTSNNRQTISGGNIGNDQWAHVAVTYDPSSNSYVLYVNAQEVARRQLNGFGAVNTSGTVRIGPQNSSGLLLMDEVKVSNVARRAYEIAYNANVQLTSPPSSALANRIPDYLNSLRFNAVGVDRFSTAAAALGEDLFDDVILSKERTTSCGTCHNANLAFTDGLDIARGNEPTDAGFRNTPTLLNRLFSTLQGWSGEADGLNNQALVPIAAVHEMNLPLDEAIQRLRANSSYNSRFQQVYGEQPNEANLTAALASFQAIQFSPRNRVDEFKAGNRSALNASERRGLDLFEGDARCSGCHAGDNYTDESFRNNGLAANDDIGRADVTGRDRDHQLFKVPTLRELGLTGPYMHDGSIATLREVVEAYNRGALDDPATDTDMRPLELSNGQMNDLVAYLTALSENGLSQPNPNPEVSEVSRSNGLLVGGNGSARPGFALYVFENDIGNAGSVCNGGCAAAWPPVIVSDSGASGIAGLSTITRQDGSQQAAFNGRPLYFYAQDTSAGQTSGDGVNNVWFLAEGSSSDGGNNGGGNNGGGNTGGGDSGANNLRDADTPQNTVSGVQYQYFHGEWSNLPNFDSLQPVDAGIVSNFELNARTQNDRFGFSFTGFVNVPSDGEYTFYTRSDDGSKLYIGNTEIVDNDGLHGMVEQSGSIGLKAGKHAIKVDFFERTGGEGLEVYYSGPAIAKQRIPASALSTTTSTSTAQGTITREVWTNISGTGLNALTGDAGYPNNPDTSDSLTSFEAPVNWANNYGTRISGYLHAPTTGQYTFWISSDDQGELWLSTDDSAQNKRRIANVPGWSSSRQWTKYTQQRSAAISLQAGQRYYIEALQKEGGGGDNLAVAWQRPGATQEIISGDYLSPNTSGSGNDSGDNGSGSDGGSGDGNGSGGNGSGGSDNATGSISMAATSFEQGFPVVISYQDSASNRDWIGIFPAEALPATCVSNEAYLDWQYAEQASGTLSFANVAAGEYVAQMFANDGNCYLGNSISFSVTQPSGGGSDGGSGSGSGGDSGGGDNGSGGDSGNGSGGADNGSGDGGTTTQSATFETRIVDGNDDAEEQADGSVNTTSSDLEFVFDGGNQTIGMRFRNVSIPQGATIDRAYIQFTTDETNSGGTAVTFRAQAVDNAGAFSTSSRNISNRPITSASANWNPAAWNSVGAAGNDQRTPDLRSLVQEVVDRSGWRSGNNMAFIATGTGERTAESFNGSADQAALLRVEYTYETSGSDDGAAQDLIHIASTEDYDSRGDVRMNLPAGTREGDLLMMFLSRTDDLLPIRWSGWTAGASCYKTNNGQSECHEIPQCQNRDGDYCLNFNGGNGRDLATVVFYRTAGANEPSSYRFNMRNDKPGWGILTTLRGANNTNPIRDVATESNDGDADSRFPSVNGNTGDMLLLSMAFDDTTDRNDFAAPSGMEMLQFTNGSDEAGYLYAETLSQNGQTGTRETIGPGGSSAKDALIALTVRAGNGGSGTGSGGSGNQSGTGGDAQAGDNWLTRNNELRAGQSIESQNGQYRLNFQGDGNLVLRDASGSALWSSRTNGEGGVRVVLQGDGNLVIYTASGQAVWASGTDGTGANRLVINNDGSIALYSGDNAVWAENGSGNTGSGGSGSDSGSGSGTDSTADGVKVAFIGDTGARGNFQDVLDLIKAEGAELTLVAGDTSYDSSRDDDWDAMARNTLGNSDPVLVVAGNHDYGDSDFNDVRNFGQQRLNRQSAVQCTGSYAEQMTCNFKGLYFVLSAIGSAGSRFDHENFIRDSLQNAPEGAWRICAWHKNQRDMQVGGKSDEVGWTAYETCRQEGAFIATGHEHSYSRTHLLSDMSDKRVVSTSSTFTVEEGRSFAFVSGLGGVGIRDQERGGDWWASIYTSTQGARYGALFATFYSDRAEFYFKNINGQIIDQFTVMKGY